MNSTDFLADEISARYGAVQRARGCFLYTRKGVRLTDLYQEGGRAILGWGGSCFTVFKNVLSRGLTGSYDTDFTGRIARAAGDLLASGRIVGIYDTQRAALQTALAAGKESTSMWKPWLPDAPDWSGVAAVVIEPPLPWTQSLWITAMLPSAQAEAALAEHPGIKIPAPLAAAAARSMYDMIAALQERKETDWFIYDPVVTKYWTRKGPYLYPKLPRGQYEDFVKHCLDCALVISPVYETPSIVPFGADAGVFRKLKNTPFAAEGC